MRNSILVLVVLALSACASQKRVPTFKEAVSENEDLESGVYNKRNGENVSVEVKSMRSAVEEAEKKAYEAQREADYNKLKAAQLQEENVLLRARGNYKLEKQVNDIQGFDRQNNPVIHKGNVNQEPAERPETSNAIPRIVGYSAAPRPAPAARLPANPTPVFRDPRVPGSAQQVAQPAQNVLPEQPAPALPKAAQAAPPAPEQVMELPDEARAPTSVVKAAPKAIQPGEGAVNRLATELPEPLSE